MLRLADVMYVIRGNIQAHMKWHFSQCYIRSSVQIFLRYFGFVAFLNEWNRVLCNFLKYTAWSPTFKILKFYILLIPLSFRSLEVEMFLLGLIATLIL